MEPIVDDADELDSGAALERAIALVRSLPPDQAEVIMLRIIADLDVSEVASIVGTTEGNVRVIMHRGLRRLAAQLSVTQPSRPTIKSVP